MRIEFIGFTESARGIVPGLSEHSRYSLERGGEYNVFGLSVVSGIVFLCVISDSGFPLWIPGVLVDLVDGTVPADWKLSLGDGDVSLVQGPIDFMDGIGAYISFVEMEPEPVQKFWSYIEKNNF